MLDQYSRTQILIGKAAVEKLRRSHVAVFGIGGVGGYAVEALARSGVGALDLIDDDRVCLTNLNRQLFATRKTVGRHKVDAAAERIAEIEPRCAVRTYKTFYLPETEKAFDFTQYDYIIRHRHRIRQDRAGDERACRGDADHQRDGRWKQAGSVALRGCGHLRDLRVSFGARHAAGAAQARRRAVEGGLFQGKTDAPTGGHVNFLPFALYLPARRGAHLPATTRYPRLDGVCAVGRGTHHCGRGGQGPDAPGTGEHGANMISSHGKRGTANGGSSFVWNISPQMLAYFARFWV